MKTGMTKNQKKKKIGEGKKEKSLSDKELKWDLKKTKQKSEGTKKPFAVMEKMKKTH